MSASVKSPPMPVRAFAPLAILVSGCIVAMLTFGPRSSMGVFAAPILSDTHLSLSVFSFAIAIQNLLWGVGQPFAGAIADRYGTMRVLTGGLILHAAGLALMAYANSGSWLTFSAGVLIGFGLSGCSFNIVLASFSKLLPPEWRSVAYGAGTAAGSLGQLVFPPLSYVLITTFGWQAALLTFAPLLVAVLPLAYVLATQPNRQIETTLEPEDKRGLFTVIAEAFGHRSYVLLVLGFFTCGFQLAFITVHMPRYLLDVGLGPEVGGFTLGIIGLFNIIGSLTSGYLGSRMSRSYLLASIYVLRSAAILMLIMLPHTAFNTYLFGAAMGLLWLSTVPPTSSLVALMFGTRNMAMLYGFAFFSHQVGGFLGVLIGGGLRDQLGSYDVLWWGSIALGIISAAINLPIVEKPAPQAGVAPAAA
ncbi:MAG: MFS transporter [Beijerinckiaceae bacterium]|nr:MFS transporter [Beijerinckiaceae bacterium]